MTSDSEQAQAQAPAPTPSYGQLVVNLVIPDDVIDQVADEVFYSRANEEYDPDDIRRTATDIITGGGGRWRKIEDAKMKVSTDIGDLVREALRIAFMEAHE